MSHSPSDWDVSADNIPSYTPQNIALERKETLSEIQELSKVNSYEMVREDNSTEPFPVPETENEAIEMLADIIADREISHAVIACFRKRLMDGKLTRADIEEYFRRAA